MKTASAWLGSAVAAVVAVPAVGYVLDPLFRRRAGKADWKPIVTLDALRDAQPRSFPVIGDKVDAWTRAEQQRLGMVWIRKKESKKEANSEPEIVAFNAECPHLGCKIGYQPEDNKFVCPCHDATFALDGSVLSGPPPRPMDRLQARVKDGQVWVRFQRFRTQVDYQEEV